MSITGSKTAIIGVGYSSLTRNPSQSLAIDTLQAATNAIADAGLNSADIDGLSSAVNTSVAMQAADGVNFVTPTYLSKLLKLPELAWSHREPELVSHALIAAINALSAGACQYVLVWQALTFPKGTRYSQDSAPYATGTSQFLYPYGHTGHGPAGAAASFHRYMDRYGATREDLGTFVINNRQNALLNEHGYWNSQRPKRLTIDNYLSSRMIADPLCILDCDIPIHGCAAWVLSSGERAQAAPHHAYIAGYAACDGGTDFNHLTGLELSQAIGRSSAKRLWRTTGLSHTDIATANLYDGFSPYVLFWLEALGFCAEGEAVAFIQEGHTTLGGSLPLNTSGGSLGEGRLHGAPHISESVLQVMGRAGARQVKDARLSLFAMGNPRAGASHTIVFARDPL